MWIAEHHSQGMITELSIQAHQEIKWVSFGRFRVLAAYM
jgi:hypothetical protein